MFILLIKPSALGWAIADCNYADLIQHDPDGGFCRVLASGARMQLKRLLTQVAGMRDDPAAFNAGLTFATLAAWRAFRVAPELPVHEPVHPAVELAARYLISGDDDEDLSKLAAACDLSSSRLSRLFHQQLGVTLVSFRNSQRLARYFELRKADPAINTTLAAFEAGFGSYAQFYKVYRQAMGTGPARHEPQSKS